MDPAMHTGMPPAGQPPLQDPQASQQQAQQQAQQQPGPPPGYAGAYQNPYNGAPMQGNPYPGASMAGNPYPGAPTAGNPYQQFPQAPRERFGGGAIAGIVIVTLGWALALMPLIVWAGSMGDYAYGSGWGGLVDLIAILGILTLVASVGGFIAALRNGNKKLAARLYIIPSLVWQSAVVALILWLLYMLFTYGIS
ncbi:hypothetical protein [Arthrobacter sp. zg-Y1143]|uniref:hypothetical protein n=1 Tax=Arthrobacter sp. zg-Y1143 TaxID=3049065 RepID=UPI0024C248F3|nr:hypothetical protein [Arthrobacter sp. zg-Y1143]MDK1327938.1 hypothetical protein [Arthrobacter sp. zg-Y1143]